MTRGNRRRRLIDRLAAVGGSLLVVSATLAVTAGIATAAATANLMPTTQVGQNEWSSTAPSNPANAFAASGNDGAYVTTAVANADEGYGGFGLSVPKGSIVSGITIRADAKSTDDSGCVLSVRLSGNGGSSWTGYLNANLTQTETVVSFGGAANPWGTVWDPTQFTNANFRLELRNINGSNCADPSTTSVDWVDVTITYTTMEVGTANAALSGSVCKSGDFNFVIDMSGSIGAQGNLPSNLQQLKDGINGFVNAFQNAGGDGRYAGTKFSGSSASTITSGYVSSATFQTAVGNLSGPSGLTPTSTGIATGAGNDANDRAGVPNVMFVLTDGSPNKPNTHSDDLDQPGTWLQGANAAIGAANDARNPGGYVVEAVYLSTPQDPGDTSLPFSSAGDSQWATHVMDQIGGGDHFDSNFNAFVNDLFDAIDCPPPPPASIHIAKTANPAGPVNVGGQIGFDITISNTGQGAATDVTIHDSLPAGAGLDWSLSPAFSGCAITGAVGSEKLDCSFATLAAGGSKGPIHVVSATAKGDCGTIDNTATVSASNDDSVSNGATVTVQCPDVSVVKTPHNGTVNAGQNAVFTIVVTNAGPGSATNVTLNDPLPAGYTWTLGGADKGSCSIDTAPSPDLLACAFGSVPANGTRTVTLTAPTTGRDCAVIPNTATVTASNEKTAGNNNSDSAAIDVLCGNVGIVKTANPAGPVSAGSDIGFDIAVSNTGDGSAEAVHVTDDLPAGIAWTADATTGTASASCSIDTAPSPDVLTCDSASMPAGTAFTVHIHGTTDAGDCGTISNTAVASSGNDGGGTSTATVAVGCPDVKVTKTPDNGIVNAGDPITWTIKVENLGPGVAKGVTATDTLPSGIAWGESEADCSIASGILSCTVGDLAAGASKTYQVSGPSSKADCGGPTNNTGSAAATNEPAGKLGNNSDAGSVTVQCADISITKTANPAGPVSAGAPIGFDVTISNAGPGIASSVTVHDDLPADAGLDWSLSPAFSGCAITGAVGDQDLDCIFSTLGAGASKGPIHVTSTTTAADCGTVTNTATGAAGNDGRDDASASVAVQCPDVHVSKTAPIGTISAGDAAGFTIVVGNSGPGIAKAVTLTDDLPSGIAWSEDSASCGIAAGTLTCDFGDLAAGASATVHLTGTTDAADCGQIHNTAVVSAANEPKTATEDDTSSATIVVDCPTVSVVKTAVDPSISAGESAAFGIVVSNAGPGVAKGVVISDTLPAGIGWTVDDTTHCEIAAGVLTCTFPTIAAGADVTVVVTGETTIKDCGTLSNMATVSATNDAPTGQLAAAAVDGHTSTASITVDCPQVGITKTADAASVSAGDPIGFTITISNNGAGTAFNVAAADVLPAGLAWVIDPASAGWSIAGGTLSFGPASLSAKTSTSVHITAPTDAADCGQVHNTVSFTYTGGGDSDSSEIAVDCPDIAVRKTADDSPIVAGQEASYTISVSNADGAGIARDVTLDDVLPAGILWAENSADCSIAAGSLQCDFGDLAGGESRSVEVFGWTSRADCADLPNTATGAAANEASDATANDTSSATIAVRCPTLTLDKTTTDADGLVEPVETVSYGIAVSVAEGPVTNVIVTDTLPAGQTYVAGSQTSTPVAVSFSISPDGRTLTWTYATLPTGAPAVSIAYSATIDSDAPADPLTNDAQVCVAEPLVTCAGDTVTVIPQRPAVDLVKTAGDAADGTALVTEPGAVTYHYLVTNTGPLTLDGITVTDDNGTPGEPGDDFLVDCPVTSLAPAASMTCSTTLEILEDTVNVAVVHGVTSQGNPVEATDDATVDVLVHGLTIAKTNDAPIETLELPNGSTADLPTADEGETVTFTLTYTFTGDPVSHGTVTDVLPHGLEYVDGSATDTDEFTFAGYDEGSRTLTWTAESVSASGVLTYRALVGAGASELVQPLTNVAVIDSDQTEPSDSASDVYVPAIPAGATDHPSAPPTDTLGSTDRPSDPGAGLPITLAILAGLIVGLAFVTPIPAPVRRRTRR